MIEISSIFLQLLFFLIIFSFPFKTKFLNNFFDLKENTINLIDCHVINIIFFMYILLILSFLNIDIELIFNIYIVISVLFLLINYKNFFIEICKINLFKSIYLLILLISIFISIAHDLKLEWDGHFWIEKALVFFQGREIQNLVETNTHPHYPHLGSYIWAFFWKNSIIEFEYFGRFFYAYFYIFSILALMNTLNIKSIKIILILIFSIILLTYDSYLFKGYQEYLIFGTLVIASRFIFLINFYKKLSSKKIFLILSTLYLLVWFKQEGLVYYLIFSILLILSTKNSYLSKFNWILLIFFSTLTQYLLKYYVIGIYAFGHSNIANYIPILLDFNLLITKIFEITKHIIITFIKYPMWIVVILAASLLINKKDVLDLKVKYFVNSFLINIIFIYGTFINFENLDFYLKVSLDRLLLQTLGFYIILVLMLLNNNKLKILNLK
jgi:hypothetical protein